MRKPNHIQLRLFKNYTTIMIVTLFLFLVIFYTYTSALLKNRATESLSQLSSMTVQQLDLVLTEMNTIQKRILFTEQSKQLIFNDSKLFERNDVELQREFNYLATLALAPQDFRIFQLNFYNLNGNHAGVGQNYFVKKTTPDQFGNQALVTEILELSGKKIISTPHIVSWAGKYTPVISLYRSYYENFSDLEPTAIIETQVDYQRIIDIVNKNLSQLLLNNNKKIIVYDENMRVIYPWSNSDLTLDHYFHTQSLPVDSSIHSEIHYTIDNEKVIIMGTTSDFSGWTVLAIENENGLLAPIKKLRNSLLLIGFIAVCVTLLINYLLAQKISRPIKKIHNDMKNLKLDELPTYLPQHLNSGIVEIDGLHRVFTKMLSKLQDSLDAVVAAKSLEIQSRLNAIQSQMNPHFLYNTLAIIKIMGKESSNKGIVDICTNLSKMLRYISSSPSNNLVWMRDELDHTSSYLDLMKIRFQDNLSYNINIPDELHFLKIPRLIIQPLVENSIKFSTEISPPWHVEVSGKIEGNYWFITVSDNGPGFTEQNLREYRRKLCEFDVNHDIPSSQINGMALINIFARLKILYGHDIIFEIESLHGQGASITLGGKL